jgi:uncharacterized membrane protein YoaK (UPF0700 family)
MALNSPNREPWKFVVLYALSFACYALGILIAAHIRSSAGRLPNVLDVAFLAVQFLLIGFWNPLYLFPAILAAVVPRIPFVLRILGLALFEVGAGVWMYNLYGINTLLP